MRVVRDGTELKSVLEPERRADRTIGFVPTMGYLHPGHLSLSRIARDSGDVVVMSIFVNPLQFGEGEDFEAYPRDEERDFAIAEEEKIDVVFAPFREEIYPAGSTAIVSAGRLATIVEGEHRPGHFDGVTTVVAKLFHLVEPQRAYFGQKDAQQVAVIKKMVGDLFFPLEVVVGETIREPDGLALSSRNAYLSKEERERAPALYRALREGAEVLRSGEGVPRAEKRMEQLASEAGFALDYARVVHPDTFEPLSEHQRSLLVIAGRLGRTRLIDNLLVS